MSSANLFDLGGDVAVVTGGNGGIGRSIALGLARAGAAVAVLARNEEKSQRVLGELKALGARAVALRLDVTDRRQLQPGWEQVERARGPVSVLVNNAGGGAFGGVLELSPEDWDRTVELNLNSTFLLSKLAAASMVKERRGKIINIAGMYAIFGGAFAPAYSATKGALVQLTKSMAIEVAPHNIQVNAIAPGFFETDLTGFMKTTPVYQEVIARTPAGRWGHPDDLVGAAVFLASRAADFVTGSTLVVDGGYSIR